MQSGMSNKAEAIANLIFDKNTVNLLIKNDLLPTTLVYDENFNTGEGRETINASFNKSNKVTTIGPRFMSILSNNNVEYRKQAIRKLIHEKLHDKLHSDGNEHFIKDIESIYDEFCKYLDDAEFSKPILEKYLKKAKLNKSLDEYYDNFKKYKYLSKQNKDVALEEFLVDSLTSVELANYLNNITGLSKVNMKKLKRDSLLNKIMRVLAKLIGIKINNDSLYAQEFEAIRNAIDSTAEITEEIDNKNEKLDNKNEQDNIKQEQEIEPEKDEDENSNIYQDLNDDYNFDEYSSTTIEDYNEELPSELQEIKDKAIADGTFMKAPNGKQSNLNEKQWLQVRTKEFKDWFGDWENDSANASKVIDENGEPRVVYRGINDANKDNLFAYFSDTKTDARVYAEGLLTKGGQFYANNKNIIFAINKVLSEKYKLPYLDLDYVDAILYDYSHDGEEYEVNDYEEYEEENEFLPITETKRRFVGTHKEIYKSKFSKEEIQAAEKTINIVENNKEVQELLEIINLINNTTFLNENDIIRQADDTNYIEDEKKLNNLLNKYNDIIDSNISEYKPNVQEVFLNIKNPYVDEIVQEDLLDNYKSYRNGYDGAFLLSGMHFLVKTRGNQIKSATDNIGAFNTKDNNIYNSDTIEEYETVASIGDYIQSYSPEDRAEIAREINNGNISIKCK